MVLQPRLIVADEPTTMLDVSLRLELLALMRRLGEQQGISYLYITHDLALARAFCDRLVILHQGHVVEEGPRPTIIERPAAPVHRASGRGRRHPAGPDPARPATTPRSYASPQ